jgi:hypothetical protein
VDILAIFGVGYLLRWLRRGRAQENPGMSSNHRPSATSPVPPTLQPCRALLLRATRGLLLAGTLLLLALLPWPDAWATSAALAPSVLPWRLWVVANVDVLTVSLVLFALIESLLARLLRAIRQAPRLLQLLVRLMWVLLRIHYWRYRNWRRCAIAV